MRSLATTQLSSKGQVVIPDAIRKQMNLQPGTQFVVVGQQGAVLLKTITPPSPKEFTELLKTARVATRRAGIRPADVRQAIQKVRGR